jgi:general secretion pathway protein I
MSKPCARRADAERGFTLIEVLVAFAIAALLLVPLLRIFSGGIGGLTRADRAATAALWAQTVLDARNGEAPVAAGAEEGDLPGGYHWQRTVTVYGEAAMSLQPRAPLVPYAVTLTVTWSERGRTRTVTLDTLELAPPPAQG